MRVAGRAHRWCGERRFSTGASGFRAVYKSVYLRHWLSRRSENSPTPRNEGSEACRAVWRGSGVWKSSLARTREPPSSPSPFAYFLPDRPPKLVLPLRPNPLFASREFAGRSPRSPPRTSRRPIKLTRPPGGQIFPHQTSWSPDFPPGR